MAIAGFKLAKGLGVGYLATIANLHPEVMMQHFVVYDALYNVQRHVTPIQNGIDTDSSGSVRIAAEFDGILISYPPVGSPRDKAVNHILEVFTVDFLKERFEIEEVSPLTQYCALGPRMGFPDLGGVSGDKISQLRWCFLASALNKISQ
jgi:hypothetical protein